MKKSTAIWKALVLVILLTNLLVLISHAQTIIVSDGFENSTTHFTINTTGTSAAYYSGNSASGDAPATSPLAVEGSYSFGVTNATSSGNVTSVLTSTNDINTTSYSDISLSLRAAAFSVNSSTGGVENADYIKIGISTNGGSSYTDYLTVQGYNSSSQNRWAYSATGIATTAYGTTATFAPTGSGSRTTDGYSTLRITSLPSVTTLRIRITIYDASSTANGERWNIDDFKITGTISGPAILTNGTLSNFVSPAGTPSESQSYTVSGVNLTSDISISAPAGFEISTDDITYGPNLTLPQSGGTVSSTTIYVRINSPDLGTYSGNITHTSTDATQKDIAVNGTVAVYYSLTVNTDSRGNVELSPAGGSYASGTEVTLTATGNTGFTFESWTGDLSGSANPALLTIDGNKTVTANFTEGGNESLIVSEDTHMRSGSTRGKYNYGNSATIRVNPYYSQGSTDGQLTGALLKWDLSDAEIPVDAQVTSASITFYVTTGSDYAYGLYNMRQAWVEGTNNGATGSGASWSYYGAGTGDWETEGAQSTASDRYDVNLWNATAADFNTTGYVTFNLNSEGLSVIQGWISSTLVNNGLTIQNYDGNAVDVWEAASSEASEVAQRPRLNITYSTSSDPSITTTGTLDDFTSSPGVPSASQTYTISGRHLTDVITIAAPTGFEISEDGTTFTSNLTLTPVDGVVTGKSIYVRMYSSYEASLSGNIAHTSSGAIQKNIAVTGLVSSNISVSLDASEDTYMSSYNETNNYGTSTTLKSTRNGSTSNVKRGTLLRWNLSSIPATAVVTSASVTLYVSTSSSQTYNLYNMRQSWIEGTGASAETGDGATWLTYNGSDSWGSSGAADITTDRYDVNLWDAGTTSFSSAGTRTVNLNTEGLAVIQEWINGSVNNGLTIQNYSSSSINDDLQFASSENATNNGPTLNLTYSVATGITHTLTVTTDGHGNISLNPAGGVYTENSVITLTPVPNTGYEFSGWDGENDIDLVDNGNGTWSITMNEDKSLTGFFTETPTNDAPNEPTLMQPADNGTDVSTSPLLEITVSDPDVADMLDINFYGREAGTTTTSPDFTFVLIPDPQNFASTGTLYDNEMLWIKNNMTDSNIVFVTCVGDLVNTSSSTSEYSNADAAFDILDAAGVPYSVSPGNHDEGFGGTVEWPNYFGTSRFSGKSWFREAYNNFNFCSFFSASGNDFIVINLEYNPGTAVLTWADELLGNNPTRRGIVVQHDILNTNNSWNNQASFTALKNNPNLFMMLCGHMHSGSDGAAYREELGDDGHTIHVVQADYQDISSDNFIRLLRFSPSEDMIYMTTYAPNNGSKIITSPDQMNMVYDMYNGTSTPYELIGTDEYVANSANASTTWPELLENTEYEWYATVSDGLLSTTGPVWSFTTGSISANYILTMAVNGNGTTDPSVGTHSYPTGTVVTITANPSTGYQFVSWNGEVADPNSQVTAVTMNASKTVTANFTALNNPPVITEGETVSVSCDEDNAPASFALTLHASDADDDEITWSVSTAAIHGTAIASGTGTSKEISYIPHANYNGTDLFIVTVTDNHGGTDNITVNVTVNSVNDAPVVSDIPDQTIGEGSAFAMISLDNFVSDVDNSDNEMAWTFTGNTNLAISIVDRIATITIPISGWTGSETITFTATDNDAVNPLADSDEAKFTVSVDEFGLSIVVAGNGTVNCLPNQTTFVYGTEVKLSASANAGWTFAGWSGDLTGNSNPATLIMDADKTVTATFTRDEYTLTTGVSGSGSVTRSPDQATYHYGDVVQLTATGSSGWTFSGWSGNLTGTDNPATITMDANKSVTAIFTGTTITQEIELLDGWNIFSLYVTPANANMLSIVQPLIDNGSLVKVQDEGGNAIEYDPIEGEWINEIGNWRNTEGYKIRVNSTATLNVTGISISDPVDIILGSGWNIISFPASSSEEAMTILNSLMTSGHLVKVQDEKGDAVELNPITHNWIDDIVSFMPDEGYKVRVSADEEFTIDPSSISGFTLKSAMKSALSQSPSLHFKPNWTGNGLDQMNVYIADVSKDISGFNPGDEIGIFDGDNCVGSGIIDQYNQKFRSIVVSVDDPTTVEVDGFIAGHAISLKVWRPSNNNEISATILEFADRSSKEFTPLGTSIICLNAATLDLDLNKCEATGLGDSYPNPVMNTSTIPFSIGQESVVDITIYNYLGEKISTLVHGTLAAGSYSTAWNIADLNIISVTPGVYLCKMVAGGKVFVKRIEVADVR